MARRRPFGAKASPATVEGASSVRKSPLFVCRKAVLPADQATLPSGPSATWSIQRLLASEAYSDTAPPAVVTTTLPSSPPVTMRSPSLALDRMAPPWTRTRFSSCSGANSSASSPSTNTGVAPRTCAATMAPSAGTARTRSAREGMGAPGSLTLRRASRKALADSFLRQIPADEDDAAFALLVGAPRALVIAVEDHVHALEHETLGVVLEGEDAFRAQDVRPVLGDEILHPGKELVRVQRFVALERHGLHVFVVIVLETVAMMMVIAIMAAAVTMVMIVVVMLMVVMLVCRQEIRLDVEDAVEIESVAAEHFVDLDLRALGAMDLGIGIDGADARLDFGQFGRA